jgi:hypothetical protein
MRGQLLGDSSPRLPVSVRLDRPVRTSKYKYRLAPLMLVPWTVHVTTAYSARCPRQPLKHPLSRDPEPGNVDMLALR